MTDFPFRCVGFDLDGTLVESHRDLGEAVNHALTEGGFDPVPVEDVTGLIGGGAKVMLRRALDQQGGVPDDEFRKLYKTMLRYYDGHVAVHTRPYPCVIAVLDELAARGVVLSVVTNKFEGFARGVLGALDLTNRFACIIGGDTLGKDDDGNYRAKPLADPINAAREASGGGSFAFVGDSSYDVMAARAAGVPVVAAAYGYCDGPAEELGADAVIADFAGLVSALEGLPNADSPR